ncbi:hypothetical protein THAOC_36587, partial [Thalassiosira oceanica]
TVARATDAVALKARSAAVCDTYANQGARNSAILPFTSALSAFCAADDAHRADGRAGDPVPRGSEVMPDGVRMITPFARLHFLMDAGTAVARVTAPQGKNCAASASAPKDDLRLRMNSSSSEFNSERCSGTVSSCSFDWRPPFRDDDPPLGATLENLPAWSTRDVHLIPRSWSPRRRRVVVSHDVWANELGQRLGPVVGFGRKVASWKALVELFK